MIEIPHHQLSPDTLRGLIEDFITREGTDYGEHEWTLEDKTQQVLTQLNAGKVVVVYDETTESCTIVNYPYSA